MCNDNLLQLKYTWMFFKSLLKSLRATLISFESSGNDREKRYPETCDKSLILYILKQRRIKFWTLWHTTCNSSKGWFIITVCNIVSSIRLVIFFHCSSVPFIPYVFTLSNQISQSTVSDAFENPKIYQCHMPSFSDFKNQHHRSKLGWFTPLKPKLIINLSIWVGWQANFN